MAVLELAYTGGDSQNPDYYVYNNVAKGGFVMIAGDARADDIIPMYSTTDRFVFSELPEQLLQFLSSYSANINAVRRLNVLISR